MSDRWFENVCRKMQQSLIDEMIALATKEKDEQIKAYEEALEYCVEYSGGWARA